MKYDYTNGTDGLIRPGEIDSPLSMLQYFSQETGVVVKPGPKNRGMLIKRMNEEMTYQLWTYQHLVASIAYMKNRSIKMHSFDYVFWNVGKAVAAGYLGDNRLTVLDEQVAEAIFHETDPQWIRRLSLAKGEARRLLYEQWREERGLNAFGV